MAFDPDAYLAEKGGGGFNPDAYLAEKTGQQPPYSTKDFIGDVGRPLLEGGGAAVGGLLGSPVAPPFGSAAGGALGFAAGKAGADLLDRSLGRKPLLKNVGQAAYETGGDLKAGGEAEAMGQVASKVASPILGSLGKARNLFGEWATGVKGKDFRSVANNPTSIFPGTLAKAGERFGQAEADAGISNELTPEAVDRLRSPGQYAFDTFNKLKTEGSITPQEALHARQSLDAMYPVPNAKNGSYIRMLDQIREEFQNVISNTTPELKAASKDYAIAKSGSKFQTLLPQNKSGTPSFIRGAAVVGGLAAGHPSALMGVPAVSGGITAATGALGTGINTLVENPETRRVITAGAMELTKDKVQEFLDQANGDRSLARQLAKKAGYSW